VTPAMGASIKLFFNTYGPIFIVLNNCIGGTKESRIIPWNVPLEKGIKSIPVYFFSKKCLDL